mgnify:CR=1 FL=1
MLRGITRDGDNFVIVEGYGSLWFGMLRKFNLVSHDNFLRGYMWYMYSSDSPYIEVEVIGRVRVVYEYEYSGEMGLSEFEGLLSLVRDFVPSFLGIFESQEERVYRELRERIDRLIMEYSKSAIDLEKLDSEPKKVKAIGDLLGIKERLGVSIGNTSRNRGKKEDSIIENL